MLFRCFLPRKCALSNIHEFQLKAREGSEKCLTGSNLFSKFGFISASVDKTLKLLESHFMP